MGVKERIERLVKLRALMDLCWTEAVEKQADYYNRCYKDVEFKVGSFVGLSIKNFRFKKGERKLAL